MLIVTFLSTRVKYMSLDVLCTSCERAAHLCCVTRRLETGEETRMERVGQNVSARMGVSKLYTVRQSTFLIVLRKLVYRNCFVLVRRDNHK